MGVTTYVKTQSLAKTVVTKSGCMKPWVRVRVRFMVMVRVRVRIRVTVRVRV